MFFCRDANTRKHAKATIEKSGLLEKLPGFRVVHQSKRPDMGSVVLRATYIDWVHPTMPITSASKVYFDPTYIKLIGMPVFVRHSNAALRSATANVVFVGTRYLYLSVSHVFLPEHTEQSSDQDGSDNDDFDFGSDTSSEFGDETSTEALPFILQV